MPIAPSARIHHTAIIAAEADIAEGVEIGPFVIIEGPVRLGPNCRVRARAHLIGPMTIGKDNDIGIGVILGERPQHLQYKGEPTRTEIGNGNIFREYVTIHRGTVAGGGVTTVGDGNFLMAACHLGHDVHMGNNCILANVALIAGHCELHDRVILSGNTGVQQYVRIGRLALLSGNSSAPRDLPPYLIAHKRGEIIGVNVVGMRRAGMAPEEIAAVRQAHQVIYRQRLILSVAMERLERELGHSPAVMDMVGFIRQSKRGVIGGHHAGREHDSEAA
jgi:UDP-N-acetylglucosamine acyltransferase